MSMVGHMVQPTPCVVQVDVVPVMDAVAAKVAAAVSALQDAHVELRTWSRIVPRGPLHDAMCAWTGMIGHGIHKACLVRNGARTMRRAFVK